MWPGFGHSPRAKHLATSEAFREFLQLAAAEAGALLLPGDIFDAWIGDDIAVLALPWLAHLMALRWPHRRFPVWLGRGNRWSRWDRRSPAAWA